MPAYTYTSSAAAAIHVGARVIFIDSQKDSLEIEIVAHEMPNSIRRQMGFEGRSKVESEFSREIVIRAYIKKIEELV